MPLDLARIPRRSQPAEPRPAPDPSAPAPLPEPPRASADVAHLRLLVDGLRQAARAQAGPSAEELAAAVARGRCAWRFGITRDRAGLITEIIATPIGP